MPQAFPSPDPEAIKEVVSVSHGNLPRVRELVEKQPVLARASLDWSFGDWESCIDAASHTGRRDIAEFLIANGARPTIFTAAMMGQLEVVKAFVAAKPGVQRTYGPHGLTLMAHARAGGKEAEAVVQYLQTLGDADVRLPSTPLEAADRESLIGRYVFGTDPREYFEVDAQKDQLGINRPGAPARRTLIHTGSLAFYPTGVPTCKIAFARGSGKEVRMVIADGLVQISGVRLV